MGASNAKEEVKYIPPKPPVDVAPAIPMGQKPPRKSSKSKAVSDAVPTNSKVPVNDYAV